MVAWYSGAAVTWAARPAPARFHPHAGGTGADGAATDTGLTGTSYSTDTVSGIPVIANTPVSLLARVPGETYAEGTAAGKTGAPSVLTAGTSDTVDVRSVDLYNNRANDGRQVPLIGLALLSLLPVAWRILQDSDAGNADD